MGPDDGYVPACMYRGRSAVLFDESNHPVVFSGSSPPRVGNFGLISYRVEHAGEDFEAQVLLIA